MTQRDAEGSGYSDAVAGMEDFGVSLVALLREMLRQHGVVVHTIDHRVKTEQSARRKIESSEGTYEGYSGLNDLLGLRITCYFSDAVERVAEIIDKEFQFDPAKSIDKGAQLGVKEFGYRSIHRVAWMREDRANLAEYIRFKPLRFEVQIRTVLQHAWAEIEHDLGYKQETIPEPMSRRFSMLAGVLELVDYEFESLRKELEKYEESADKAAQAQTPNMALDVATLVSMIKHDATMKSLDRQVAEAVGRKLGPGEPNPRYMEQIIVRCRDIGMHSISDVRRAIDAWQPHILDFVPRWMKYGDEDKRLRGEEIDHSGSFPSGVGVFYLWLVVGLEATTQGWSLPGDMLKLPGGVEAWAETVSRIGPPPPLPEF